MALKLWWQSHHTARGVLPSIPLRRWESKPRAGGIIYEERGLVVMMAAAEEEEKEGGEDECVYVCEESLAHVS